MPEQVLSDLLEAQTDRIVQLKRAYTELSLQESQDTGSGASPTFTGLTLSGLAAGRVVYTGVGGLLSVDAGFTYNAATDTATLVGGLSAASVTDSGLTAGRGVYAGVGGLLSTDAGFLYDAATDKATFVGGILLSNLTAGRVTFAGASGLLTDDADMTFSVDTLTVTKLSTGSITDTGLTSGRVPIVSTGGLLADDADMTFATDTLTVTKLSTSSVTDSGLTSGRVVLASTGGLLADDADLAFNGSQLALAVQGSTGGILVGGDVQFYRSAADVWRTPDSLTVDGQILHGTNARIRNGVTTSVGAGATVDINAGNGLLVVVSGQSLNTRLVAHVTNDSVNGTVTTINANQVTAGAALFAGKVRLTNTMGIAQTFYWAAYDAA